MSSNKTKDHNKSWPYGIALFYGLFVLAMLGAWYFSTFHTPDMVEDNYYEQSIRYQEKIDQMNNARSLEKEPLLTFETARRRFIVKMPASFTGKSINGTILFFRPSDSKLDFRVDLSLDENLEQVVDLPNIYPGRWEVRLSWSDGNTRYYLEKIIVV